MNRLTAALLAVATVAPFVYLVVVAVQLATPPGFRDASETPEDTAAVVAVFVSVVVAVTWIVGLLTFYMIHVFINHRIPSNRKPVWAAVLLIPLAGMMVYWYLFFWRRHSTVIKGSMATRLSAEEPRT